MYGKFFEPDLEITHVPSTHVPVATIQSWPHLTLQERLGNESYVPEEVMDLVSSCPVPVMSTFWSPRIFSPFTTG